MRAAGRTSGSPSTDRPVPDSAHANDAWRKGARERARPGGEGGKGPRTAPPACSAASARSAVISSPVQPLPEKDSASVLCGASSWLASS